MIPAGIVAVIAANVVFGIGLFFHAFLYNFYLEALGHSETIMGNAAGALTLGGLIALLPAGRVTDWLGPKATLVAASIVVTAGLVAGALVEHPGAVYGAAALAGIGGGAWRVAAPPALMRLAGASIRPRAFGWNVGLLIASGGIGMAVAGSVPDWLQAGLGLARLPAIRVALVLGAAGSALSLPLFALLPRLATAVASPGASSIESGDGGPALGRSMLPLVGFVGLWMLGPALAAPFLNIFFTRQFDLRVAYVGVVFAGAHLLWGACVFASGGIAGRVGLLRFLTLTLASFAPLMIGLSMASGLSLAVVFFFAQGAISPLTNPLIDQLLLERAPVERHGAVSSWRNAAADLSGLVGASLGGQVLAAKSFGTLFIGAGTVGFCGAAALVFALRSLRPMTPTTTDGQPSDAGAGGP